MRRLLGELRLNTVCQQALCPNISECFASGQATFLILGKNCTRLCSFCNVEKTVPLPVDSDEPARVAEAVQRLKLSHVVITSPTRDDLPDGGAAIYAATVAAIRCASPETRIELLIPDFQGALPSLEAVVTSRPDIIAHNVETVPRLFRRIRPGFSYERSLGVLTMSRDAGLVTKSNIILGMGETREEVSQALRDLRDAGTHLVTITQYLRPNATLHPVDRWVEPAEFDELAVEATEIGFEGVLSGPLVRSSYRAGRLYRQASDALAAANASTSQPENESTDGE